ncbi:putative cyclin-D6-1 [Juglans microcarpa x Juglans regia]|uniref:putative cyclin-D6-1 n=1 Tax=Juglans microcarpa x Juglans regia TaxID=2249226 RepID=UPI001B7DDF34|nr:putative cyclin-D6-1 [Juglans microcarpa x Juglans regia]
MEFDLENPLTNLHESRSDTITSLFHIESDHMPLENYLQSLQTKGFDISVRREAISEISKFSCTFDPFLSYLAVNYLDRFLSSQGMLQPKPWVLRLLAISCVSLAAKMKETECSLVDFQGDGGFIFDSQTIERMEALILGALKWRMRSITPFSFISYFISFFKLRDPPLRHSLKARATEIIFKAQNEIKLLEFRPSIIAASALLSAAHELLPLQYPCFRKAIFCCSYVNKENLLQCYNAMQEIVIDEYESVFDMVSSSGTPVNVLDQHFSSSELSGKTNGNITTNTIRAERDMKRRKIIDHYDNLTVQISRIQQC